MSPCRDVRHTLEAVGQVFRSHAVYGSDTLVHTACIQSFQGHATNEAARAAGRSDMVASTSREDETSRGIDDWQDVRQSGLRYSSPRDDDDYVLFE